MKSTLLGKQSKRKQYIAELKQKSFASTIHRVSWDDGANQWVYVVQDEVWWCSSPLRCLG